MDKPRHQSHFAVKNCFYLEMKKWMDWQWQIPQQCWGSRGWSSEISLTGVSGHGELGFQEMNSSKTSCKRNRARSISQAAHDIIPTLNGSIVLLKLDLIKGHHQLLPSICQIFQHTLV